MARRAPIVAISGVEAPQRPMTTYLAWGALLLVVGGIFWATVQMERKG